MVYVPEIDRVVLFGGVTGPGEEPLDDTWAYDFETDTWVELNPIGSPSPRGWHGMALDPIEGTILLYGGGPTRETYVSDVWRYDHDANAWAQIGN
jgi:hypothetical protein